MSSKGWLSSLWARLFGGASAKPAGRRAATPSTTARAQRASLEAQAAALGLLTADEPPARVGALSTTETNARPSLIAQAIQRGLIASPRFALVPAEAEERPLYLRRSADASATQSLAA
jgi:hypothetical protein